MGVRVKWGNKDRTCLIFEMDRNWDWDEFYAVYKKYYAMVETVPHRVHVIYHMIEPRLRFPPLVLLHMPKLLRMSHPRQDRSVVVGRIQFAERFLAILGNMGLREYTERYHFADSLDEAFQYLDQYEADLRNKSAKIE